VRNKPILTLQLTVHVLTYVWRVPGLALADLGPRRGGGTSGPAPGSVARHGLLVGSVLLGLVIAIAAIPWDASWVHWLAQLGPES
jgi:hypothetical protein